MQSMRLMTSGDPFVVRVRSWKAACREIARFVEHDDEDAMHVSYNQEQHALEVYDDDCEQIVLIVPILNS
jgi:hypothetical protein